MAFSPAPAEINGTTYGVGELALSGSADGTLRLWDAASGQTLRLFAGHNDAVNDAVFSPDGQTILSASADHTLRLWDVDYQDFIDYACDHVFRDLTITERSEYGITDNDPTCPQFAEPSS
jgi:WD40 repeat protein